MNVARQFIAWEVCKKGPVPGGYGMIRTPGLFHWPRPKDADWPTESHRPYGTGPLGTFPGNKLPGYLHFVPSGHTPHTPIPPLTASLPASSAPTPNFQTLPPAFCDYLLYSAQVAGCVRCSR